MPVRGVIMGSDPYPNHPERSIFRILMNCLRAELHNTPLAAEFDRIYEEAREIWNEQYMLEFTAHGPLHTQQVERNLDSLTEPLQKTPNRLTPHEIFVLLSATCLHDIGMQLINDPEARRKHAQHAYDLILHSSAKIGTESRRVTLSIRDEKSRIAIAKIARAHWTDHALQLKEADWINSQNVKGRLKLLGLLLAMADLLDLSPVRARYFRTIHRLYDLSPESELHQTMHQHVFGIDIQPPDKGSPGKLQFQVEWNGDYPLVHDMNDWVMDWFDSQWRRLCEPLSKESGGLIEWVHPWRDILFRPREGDVLMLSPPAHNVLKAERADQQRIDRNAFTSRFVGALKNKEAVVFLGPSESDFERHILSDWSTAYAELHDRCRVMHLDSRSFTYFRAGNIAARMLKELGQTLDAGDDAITALANFLKNDAALSLVTIIKTDNALGKSLQNLLHILLQRNGPATARICLLFCPRGKGPKKIGDATIVPFDTLLLPRDEVEEHLRKRGYSSNTSSEIYNEMDILNHTSHPTDIYTYIHLYCNHRSRMRP